MNMSALFRLWLWLKDKVVESNKKNGDDNDNESRIQGTFLVDLSGVPPQPPIPKSSRRIKEGTSKYTGVSFDKRANKWRANIGIEGKQRFIGYYDNEEEAAVDYARAVFKYRGDGTEEPKEKEGQLGLTKEALMSDPNLTVRIDEDGLIDVVKRPEGWIGAYSPKSRELRIKKFLAKRKRRVSWVNRVKYDVRKNLADSKLRVKGRFVKKEEATNINRKREEDAPPPPTTATAADADTERIASSEQSSKSCTASDVKLIAANSLYNQQTQSKKRRTKRSLCSDAINEETKKRPRRQQGSFVFDLSDVPPQPLILKNDLVRSKDYCDNTRRRNISEKSSKYTGIYFEKGMKKWKAQIMIEGRVRSIGYYEREEEAAADYARAVFKYKPKKKTKDGYILYGGLDLSCIPNQPLIRSERAKSGYKGVKPNKSRWEARINDNGLIVTLGTFDSKEEAAAIFARAEYYLSKSGESPKKVKEVANGEEQVPDEEIVRVEV
ncbi:hypothetical protein ACHAWC_005310 [Mediolabrus comicus]